jgi:uncharacterized protein
MARRLSSIGLVIVALAGCRSGPPPPEETSREARVAAERAAKDQLFKTAPECRGPAIACSPLLPADRPTFTGLRYYAFDPAARVPASLDRDATSSGVIIELPTSAEEMRRMRRVGTLKFTLRGTAFALTAFADADARSIDQLFVPFGDTTSGSETYGGGRYLELPRTATGLYDLDFNLAYHPYCVYNPTFVCPVPPRENRLPIAIHAGERLPS